VATIKDVARLAGVGLGTASRVISGRGSVAPATAERVRKAIAQLDFRPSHAARALLSGKTQMIGVYVPSLGGSAFFADVLQALEAELRAGGQHMVIAYGAGAGDAHRQAVDGVDFLLGRGCDGVLVMGSELAEADIVDMGPRRQRLVLVNHRSATIPDQCFMPDHVRGGALAALALLAQGHRRLAVIEGPEDDAGGAQRAEAFYDELARAGIGLDTVWRRRGDFTSASGWAAARAWHESGHGASALWCANDEMALGALAYFHQSGVAVPDAVSVLGYDGSPAGEFVAPRLSTVAVPWRELALNALRCLQERCYQQARPVQRDFAPHLVARASVAPPVEIAVKAA
jgi:LacI family transcriptional regulator